MFFYRDLSTGGVQRNMLRLISHLASLGFTIRLVIAVSSENEFNIPDGVEIVRLNQKNPVKLVFQLRHQFETWRPDMVYTAMPNYNDVAIAAKLLSRPRPKVIISERSHTRTEYDETPWGIYKLSMFLSPLFYRFADAIISVSLGTAESLSEFARIPLSRIEVIHNPVVSDKLNLMAGEAVDHRWASPEFKLIVSAGRLVHQKDYPTLLRAFKKLSSVDDKVRLVVIGEGPDRPSLLALTHELGIDQLVDFVGFDRNPFRWFSVANVFALSSLWEGLPTVIIEAMACGATIVATDSPSGPGQILGAEKFGFLAPIKNPDVFALKLRDALNNPIDPKLLRSEAQKYSEDESLRKFKILVERVASAA